MFHDLAGVEATVLDEPAARSEAAADGASEVEAGAIGLDSVFSGTTSGVPVTPSALPVTNLSPLSGTLTFSPGEIQVNAFQVPELEKILAYYDAVRDATKAYLRAMKPEDFDEKITFPNFGEMHRATVFSMLAIHTSEHIGEIAYLRGLQRGIDK